MRKYRNVILLILKQLNEINYVVKVLVRIKRDTLLSIILWHSGMLVVEGAWLNRLKLALGFNAKAECATSIVGLCSRKVRGEISMSPSIPSQLHPVSVRTPPTHTLCVIAAVEK